MVDDRLGQRAYSYMVRAGRSVSLMSLPSHVKLLEVVLVKPVLAVSNNHMVMDRMNMPLAKSYHKIGSIVVQSILIKVCQEFRGPSA